MRLRCSALACLVLSACLLGACTARGDAGKPIPTALFPAPQDARRLVVVLPGRVDDLTAMRRSGIVEAVHASWPDADVLLAEVTMPYYTSGQVAQRLHEEIFLPARQRGYDEIWLGGASLGGLGSLLYDRAHPGVADGLVLLAPYLGDRTMRRQIRQAGGIAQWDPGAARELNGSNWQHELWRHLHALSRDRGKARHMWLVYGDADPMGAASELLLPLLPPRHVLVRPGGHSWRVWSPALGEVLEAASTERGERRAR